MMSPFSSMNLARNWSRVILTSCSESSYSYRPPSQCLRKRLDGTHATKPRTLSETISMTVLYTLHMRVISFSEVRVSLSSDMVDRRS